MCGRDQVLEKPPAVSWGAHGLEVGSEAEPVLKSKALRWVTGIPRNMLIAAPNVPPSIYSFSIMLVDIQTFLKTHCTMKNWIQFSGQPQCPFF